MAEQPQTTERPRSMSTVVNMLLFITIGLHVLFPKAGLKIGEVPVTVADVSFAFLLVPALLEICWLRSSGMFRTASKFLLAGLAYFGIRTTLMGVTSDTIARLTVFAVYPLIFFLIIARIRSIGQIQEVVRLIGICVLLVILYGLAQRTFGENAVLVRGLTANWNDTADPYFLEDKSNLFQETGQIKLTSTYQNGANLGVNLLLLLPIASLGLKKGLRLLVFPASMVVAWLAGARSVWLGLLFLLGLWLLMEQKDWKKRIAWAVVICVCALWITSYSELGQLRIQQNSDDWLFSWSGRLAGAAIILQDTLNSSMPAVLFGIHAPQDSYAYEMLYLSVYETFGLVGLIVWISPFLISSYVFLKYRHDRIVRAAFLGVATWMFVSVSEGAFYVPPTSFNVWTLMAIGWCAVLANSVLPGPGIVRVASAVGSTSPVFGQPIRRALS